MTEIRAVQNRSAVPSPPATPNTREELIYLLSQASELEHGLMCEYLFAMFSLKRHRREGASLEQMEAIGRWDRVIAQVASQEMLHLALASNLLTSIGAAPHFERPNFPQRARYYPPGVQLVLLPFGELALRHFLFLERPEGLAVKDAEGLEALAQASPVIDASDVEPMEWDYGTVGQLYRSIEAGLEGLVNRLGESSVFVGPANAQVTGEYFRWPELLSVVDMSSARRAIETIVEQGEGCQGDWRTAHFGRFNQVLLEYVQLREIDRSFEPSRPVVPAFVQAPPDITEPTMVTNPTTARVAGLFNATYEALLQILSRFFVHPEHTHEERVLLADASQYLMFDALKPLGYLLTALPLGKDSPDVTAGPTFQYFRTSYYLPHRRAAWLVLHERLTELAEHTSALLDATGHESLASVEATLRAAAGLLSSGIQLQRAHADPSLPG